jgi:hypothetical protein
MYECAGKYGRQSVNIKRAVIRENKRGENLFRRNTRGSLMGAMAYSLYILAGFSANVLTLYPAHLDISSGHDILDMSKNTIRAS